MSENFIIRTKRCLLRPFTLQDSNSLLPILGSEEVMRYSMTGPLELSKIELLIEEWLTLYQKRGFCPWAVIYNNRLIGYAGMDLRTIDEEEYAQITFRLDKDCWGKGLATELANAIKEYAFNHLKLLDLIAIIDPENEASIRTVSKIGMSFKKPVLYGGLSLHIYKVDSNADKTNLSAF